MLIEQFFALICRVPALGKGRPLPSSWNPSSKHQESLYQQVRVAIWVIGYLIYTGTEEAYVDGFQLLHYANAKRAVSGAS